VHFFGVGGLLSPVSIRLSSEGELRVERKVAVAAAWLRKVLQKEE